jgi:PAS domain S-box-containing protein
MNAEPESQTASSLRKSSLAASLAVVAVAVRNSLAVWFGLALIILLVIAAGAYHITRQFIAANEWVAHTLKVNEAITEAFSSVQDMQSAERGYVIAADETLLEPYHAAVATANEQLKKLRSLAADNPSQWDAVAKLETLVAKEIAWTKEVIVMRRDRDREAATERVVSGMGTRIVDEIRSVVTTMRSEQDALLRARTAAVRKRTAQTVLGLGVGFAASALILLIVFHSLRRENTERKQAEESLRLANTYNRSLIEASLDPLVTIARDGKITDANAATETATGRSRAELIGTDFSVYFTEPENARAGHQQVFREGFVRDYPLELRHRDGHITSVLYNASVYRDESGNITGVFAAARDIAERKRAEEEIRKLNTELDLRVRKRTAELEASNRELEAFCYSVSHDLRAPLRTINGFSVALLEDYARKLDETGKGHLQRVRAAAQRMGELIDDLLNLSRLSRGEIHHESVDLTGMAKTVVAELRERDPQRQVEVAIADGLVAQGDPHLLRLVLDNLLGNAWKFTAKQPRARIEFGSGGGNGDREFFVRDNGAGFDMTYADKLFGAFQRLHSATEFSGTGVGLATVQRIVHRHGGQVRAHAEINKGATFYFTLS